jgi:dihydropteroate synthase
MNTWRTTRFQNDLSRPRAMGIVNVTSDSFSDGGEHAGVGAVLAHCERLLEEGAEMPDIGGESSRPVAALLPWAEKQACVLPVRHGAMKLGGSVLFDTCTTEVLKAALDLGVDSVNDICALQAPGAVQLISSDWACGAFLTTPAAAATVRGVAAERIVFNPGIGFGKFPEHKLALHALRVWRATGLLGSRPGASTSHNSTTSSHVLLPASP